VLSLNHTTKHAKRVGIPVYITTGYGLTGRGSIPGKDKGIYLHNFQADCWAYPPSYPMGTGGGSFPRVEAAGA
jgi:hypothetical protein